MKKIGIRLTALMLIMILLIASVMPVSAATTSVSLTYSKEYNSGMRDVVCTTLSGTSAASYYANNAYDDLSELSSSQLFSRLQTLMRTTHTYTSSYNDCHWKANQTDCTNGSGNVSLLYTSYSATMDQWNGWNREHVWPQSLGGNNTNGGGADMHHIRPSDAGANSSRGNKKYGESGTNPSQTTGSNPANGMPGGTYNSTYFEPLDNVKGDVARICLYVYVRWNSEWGADDITDVFQSVDVLLEWCELDPVDTWEMGRNEVVGNIQGNRNVFIDYPEYAWMLFDREVPDDLTSPSGKAVDDDLGGNSGTETPPAGDDDQGGGSVGATLVDATIANSIPTALTYITNNSDYPNPAFYSSGGLKLNFTGMGVQTAAFAAHDSVKVTITVSALNANTKSGSDADVFTVYGLDASGNVVATKTYNDVVAGENVVVLEGTGIVAVKVIMTDYAHNGSAFCNINLGGLKVEAIAEGGTGTPPAGDDNQGGGNSGTGTPPAGDDDQGGGSVGATLVDATIANSIPTALTYITNNSDYPNPAFYSSGGLKLNFTGMGVQTAAFAAHDSVKVTITVSALNANTKSGSDADVFTVYGLDASGNVVATKTYNDVVAGENVVVLEGTGIVAVKVIMTDYAHNGSAFCNINLGGIKVDGITESQTVTAPSESAPSTTTPENTTPDGADSTNQADVGADAGEDADSSKGKYVLITVAASVIVLGAAPVVFFTVRKKKIK